MPRPTIYFVRHGETDWNAQGRLQGRLDIPLNATGRSQAKRNGGVLAEILERPSSLDYVASPLMRTRQTMEILRAELALSGEGFRTDERLIEIGFGAWEGRSWREIKAENEPGYRERKRDPFNYVVPGGESYAMVMQRVIAWMASLERDVVTVAHGGIMRCLRGHVLGLSHGEILHLEVPQDKVMLVEGVAIRFL